MSESRIQRVGPVSNSRGFGSVRSSIPAQSKVMGSLVRTLTVPLLIMIVLLLSRTNDVTTGQWLMALSLLTLAWHGYCTWSVRKSHEAPLLPMIIFMFWLSYGIDLIW